MLFAWVRRRLIELRSNICHPDLRKYLCLSRHYTPFVCHLFPSSAVWWDFTLARFGRLCFVCLLLPCHPCKQTHAPHTAWCIHRAHADYHLLWMHQKGQSIQLALQISTSYVLWQHQMSAPKWTASVQQYMRSNAREEETRLWNGPSEPGPWACIANARVHLQRQLWASILGLVALLKLRWEWELQVKCSGQTNNWSWGWPEHGNSLSQLWATKVCFFFHQLFPTPNPAPTS